jgi:elongator complex protein 5
VKELQLKENVELFFVRAYDLSLKKVIEEINKFYDQTRKNLILIDSINYIDTENLSLFLTTIIKPNVTVLTTFHTSLPEFEPNASNHYYPQSLKILQFIASSILEILPNISGDHEDVENQLNTLKIVKGLNSESVVNVQFVNRRKSGRSISYKFSINVKSHEYVQILNESNDSDNVQDLSMFDNLTTFNLNTSAKQKIARDSVALPFLDAQNFESGGAIVYEFEKDDDYDEEDPYEDPF